MIVDAAETILVSHLGWVDHSSVWLCETATGEVRSARLSDAQYLSLHAGRDDWFAAVHHFGGRRLEFSAHRTTAPEQAIARISIEDGAVALEGDSSVWEHLPRHYTAYCALPEGKNDYLFVLSGTAPTVEWQSFEWYNNDYDRDYQGILGVTEIPGQERVIVSIQRDSTPVLHDPNERRAVGKIRLAGRGGNPTLRFRQTAPELWADDYDTLVRINPKNWSVRNSRRPQTTLLPGTAQFMGAFTFNQDESLCAVARPFSGDVLALNTRSFRVTHRAAIGRQPLDVALLSDGQVFARDWKTGDLLRGELKRRSLFG